MQEITTIHEEKHITHPVQRVFPAHYENIAHGLRAPAVSLCGYLRKRSPAMFHKWQKRYFIYIIEEQALLYYKHREDAEQDHRRGTILIQDIIAIEPKHDYEFNIVTPDRTYELEAPLKYVKNVWIDSLKLIHSTFLDCSKNFLVSSPKFRLDAHGLNAIATNKAIEEGLRNLSFHEGTPIAETHDVHGVTTIDVHGHEHHGRVVDDPVRPCETVVCEQDMGVNVIGGEEIVTTRNQVTQRGNLVIEKEEVTVEHGALPHTMVAQGPTIVEQTITQPVGYFDQSGYYATEDLGAYTTTTTTTALNPAGVIREFHVVERAVGEPEKRYEFVAPLENEVNIKFNKVIPTCVESTQINSILPTVQQEVVTTETVTTNPVYDTHVPSGYYGEVAPGLMDKGVTITEETFPVAQDVHIEKTTEIRTNPLPTGFVQPIV